MHSLFRRIGLLLLLSCHLPLIAQPRLHVTPSDTMCGEEAETQIRRMWDDL